MISKIKLQSRTFLFTCTLSILLVCSLIFALVPSKVFAQSVISTCMSYPNFDWISQVENINSNFDYDNSHWYISQGADSAWFSNNFNNSHSGYALTFTNATSTQIPEGMRIVDIDLNGGLAIEFASAPLQTGIFFIDTTSNTVVDETQHGLGSNPAPTFNGGASLGSNFDCIVTSKNIVDTSTFYDLPLPPSTDIYYPIKPVSTYLIQDKTVIVDCFQSGFFEDNPDNLTEIPQTCQFYLDYSATSESGEVYYSGVDDETSDNYLLDSDLDSPEHILTATGQTVINMVQTNNGKAILTLPSPVDYGTYYLKTMIVNDFSTINSVSITPLVFDGGVQTGNSVSGDYIPPIYDDCSVFTVLSGDWFDCTFGNIKTGFFESIKALFVPDLTALRTKLDDKKDIIIERSGFLGQSFYAIIDFFTTAIEYADEPDCTLSFGTVFNGSASIDFDFCTLKNTSPTLFSALQNILVITTLISFLFASYFALLKLFYGGSD